MFSLLRGLKMGPKGCPLSVSSWVHWDPQQQQQQRWIVVPDASSASIFNGLVEFVFRNKISTSSCNVGLRKTGWRNRHHDSEQYLLSVLRQCR